MLGTAADLTQQFGAADDFVEARNAELGQDFAHFLGDEGHQVDDLLGRTRELLAQLLILRADSDGAGVRMALAHHDAAHRDKAQSKSEEHTSELQSLMRISYAV